MLCAASLAACGQKGVLYLPKDVPSNGRASLPEAFGNTVKSSVNSSTDRDAAPPSQPTKP